MNLGELYRREYGRILASLIRSIRDFGLAEDALQEAFAAAQRQWPEQGVPLQPSAWLLKTARHKAIDEIRRRELHLRKQDKIQISMTTDDAAPVPRDSLRLIFTCCHPALAREAQVALTLRTVCGLGTEEIARAFFVPETTMAQRLVRAQAKIRIARIPFEIPEDEALPERLASALAVIYLVFNEGYASDSRGEFVRADLCAEAIRLGRDVVELMPDAAEPRALLALMLFSHSRAGTRVDDEGLPVLLEHQDRSKWDREQIREGIDLTQESLRMSGGPTYYGLQAAIGSLHASAPQYAATDWAQISRLYEVMSLRWPSSIVTLNQAVAIAMRDGPHAGLDRLQGLEMPGYHWLPATRAELHRRAGQMAEAIREYDVALSLAKNPSERRLLERRLHSARNQPRD